MDTDLQDRVAELEQRARRFKLAISGTEGWENWVQSLILQERDFLLDVMAETIAHLQREVLDSCKVLITEALAQRIRGTFDPKAKYNLGDVVALDGASFIARRDNPGPCPGSGWQLLARQGARGRDGPEGKRGPAGAVISGWILDRSNYRITPRLSDGSLGPPLELNELFEPSQSEMT
jgi:hypothetical protein